LLLYFLAAVGAWTVAGWLGALLGRLFERDDEAESRGPFG
jgi:hypothetical protein